LRNNQVLPGRDKRPAKRYLYLRKALSHD
jgi:hypothetical protein